MMATAASRYDWDRLGVIPRATPRQSDVMIVAGTVNAKMALVVKKLYEQMAEPKYVIAMGACTVGGGPYFKHGYHVVKGVDLVVPVDVYVPGCPPRPESLLEGLMRLQDKIKHQTRAKDDRTKAIDRLTVERVLSRGRRVEQTENREQRALSATRRSGNREILAVANLEMNIRQRVGLHFVGVEDLAQAAHLHQRPHIPLLGGLRIVSARERHCH